MLEKFLEIYIIFTSNYLWIRGVLLFWIVGESLKRKGGEKNEEDMDRNIHSGYTGSAQWLRRRGRPWCNPSSS
jgi:hypothetical protein